MKKIFVAIILGSPASNCAKYGICSIEEDQNRAMWEQFVPLHHRHVKAILSSPAPGSIQLDFPVQAMHPITPGMFFSAAGFLIESSKTIPETITHQLNLPKGSVFSPGRWPVSTDSVCYTITVPCLSGVLKTG